MTRLIPPVLRELDSNNKPYSGGKLYTYDVGTLNAKTTYSDNDHTAANTNPVVLDSNGVAGNVFFSGKARLILHTSADVLVWDRDYSNVNEVSDGVGLITAATTFDGEGVSGITNPAAGTYEITFVNAATGTDKQAVHATSHYHGISYYTCEVDNIDASTVRVYQLNVSTTTLADAFPITVTRELF